MLLKQHIFFYNYYWMKKIRKLKKPILLPTFSSARTRRKICNKPKLPNSIIFRNILDAIIHPVLYIIQTIYIAYLQSRRKKTENYFMGVAEALHQIRTTTTTAAWKTVLRRRSDGRKKAVNTCRLWLVTPAGVKDYYNAPFNISIRHFY